MSASLNKELFQCWLIWSKQDEIWYTKQTSANVPSPAGTSNWRPPAGCSREIRISGRYCFLVCRCEGIKTFSTKLWYLNTLNRNWLSGRITWKNLDIYLGLDQNFGTGAPHYHSGWFYIFYVVTFRKIWQNSLCGNNINSTNPYKKMS